MTKVQEDLYARRFAPDHDPRSFLVSKRIEKQLNTQMEEDKNTIKLLLLGSGNSGKSTVMKQFKIIHKRGFTAEERRVFRDALWKSAIDAMKSLVRVRQDYISAARLLDPDVELSEESLRERELIDLSMEPYLQYLLHRVRSDQVLYEEVVIAVAAESTNPRMDCLSPSKDSKKDASTAATTDAFSPLLTSTTVLLSSPPAAERKALDGEHDGSEEGNRTAGGQTQTDDLLLPASANGVPTAGDEESVGFGSKTSEISETAARRSRDEEDSAIGNLSPIAGSTPEMATYAWDQYPDVGGEEEYYGQDDKPLNQSAEDVKNDVTSDSQGLATAKGESSSSLKSSSNLDPQSLLMSDGHQQQQEQSGEDSYVVSEERQKKRSSKEGRGTKREFASADEEAEYLAKQERRRRKKKKKEKKSRRQQEGSEHSFSMRSDGKKRPPYCSSVESIRSDRSLEEGTKSTAPLVVWEKITIGRLLQKIWSDPLIQRMYALEEKNPQLEAPLGYIMSAMDRIGDQGFTPTNEDILFARKRTSGVTLMDFEAYGAKFLLIDVGGQRTERRKWIAHFDIVDAVIFVVGLDQYDQVMMEDGVTNRLRDSLDLFEEMCSSPWFKNSSFLLFLNKSDLFKTKIKQIPLTVCFRGYQGDPHDYDQCSKYIIRRFQQIHSQHASMYRDTQQAGPRRRDGRRAIPHVYPYMTNATDTESMRFLFDTCQDILLRSEMAEWGFFDF